MDPTQGKIRNLTCSCCGAPTRGRQWHNRDTGYGVCPKCGNGATRNRLNAATDSDHVSLYGVEGVHWNVSEAAQ